MWRGGKTYSSGVDDGALGPGDTGVGHKDIEAVVELRHDQVGGPLHILLRGDLDLVRLDCITISTKSKTVGRINNAPWTLNFFARSSAFLIADPLELYHNATFAPASAYASATAQPIPAPAPVTMAVFPLRENSARTESPSRGV